ncbi:hypothetical protein ACPFP2_03705 [Micromonospora citrea]|uniref:HNH endonuclease signature motif containing protein n=1 Tax=Micromonospora citrea TaxID=47855 RepID=UPI003C42D49F
MVRYKYTPERLGEAAAAARNVTEVLRLLGVRVSGGSHAHISRQLKRFGIDTSHFTGQAHNRGRPWRRQAPSEVLRPLTPGSQRIPGHRLKRALASIGTAEQCEVCGVGTMWQGAPLVLHVDHINGDFLDNRAPNLRLLCPNCHSQTATYAGRIRRDGPTTVSGSREDRSEPASQPTMPPPGDIELHSLVQRVSEGELTTAEAAQISGRTRDHIGRLRRRFEVTGSIKPRPHVRDRPVRRQFQDAVIRFALNHPQFGSRRIARGLADSSNGVPVISHRTVQLILKEAGLHTEEARRLRLSESAGVA